MIAISIVQYDFVRFYSFQLTYECIYLCGNVLCFVIYGLITVVKMHNKYIFN